MPAPNEAAIWCVDTSAVVAALSPWHVSHEQARLAVDERRPLLTGHVLLESYATLTRIPGHELAPAVVAEALLASFPADRPVLSLPAHDELVLRLADAGVAGGRAYDALVAATCRERAGHLLTLDRRAVAVYELVGCPYELIS